MVAVEMVAVEMVAVETVAVEVIARVGDEVGEPLSVLPLAICAAAAALATHKVIAKAKDRCF